MLLWAQHNRPSSVNLQVCVDTRRWLGLRRAKLTNSLGCNPGPAISRTCTRKYVVATPRLLILPAIFRTYQHVFGIRSHFTSRINRWTGAFVLQLTGTGHPPELWSSSIFFSIQNDAIGARQYVQNELLLTYVQHVESVSIIRRTWQRKKKKLWSNTTTCYAQLENDLLIECSRKGYVNKILIR